MRRSCFVKNIVIARCYKKKCTEKRAVIVFVFDSAISLPREKERVEVDSLKATRDIPVKTIQDKPKTLGVHAILTEFRL